jgi:SAM-dependent methyltransferase
MWCGANSALAMHPDAYREMAQTEAQHWWFAGRRAILAALLRRLRLPLRARILELGCGTGGNLDMLARFGEVSAMESDAVARELAVRRTGGCYKIRAGSCPDDIPFAAQSFDLVCLFDVLEHIEDDAATLAAVARLLREGGCAIVTVPAYRWLWSAHDEFLHHKRRYTAAELHAKAKAAGLRIAILSYFNTLLFPIVAAARLKDKLLGRERASGTGVPPAPINALLRALFATERLWIGRAAMPVGVSLFAVLR